MRKPIKSSASKKKVSDAIRIDQQHSPDNSVVHPAPSPCLLNDASLSKLKEFQKTATNTQITTP